MWFFRCRAVLHTQGNLSWEAVSRSEIEARRLQMVDPSIISNARFIYVHDNHKFPPHTVDTHHIIVRRSAMKSIVICLLAILLVAYAAFLHFEKQGKPVTTVIWSLFMFAILVKLIIQRPIVKESVIIMPEFGVQLETHYGSGKINRRFIPVSKILKPMLNEHVTPVTCCWCLSLLIRDENELTLVFKKFLPPLKMLVPIWKALCVATDCKESVEFQEDGGSVDYLFIRTSFIIREHLQLQLQLQRAVISSKSLSTYLQAKQFRVRKFQVT
ncbi:hypothetical protein R6Q57_020620 [Mikania cordata]